jgi:allantoicase
MLEGCVTESDSKAEECDWKVLLPETRLQPHKEHQFEKEVVNGGPFTHVKLTIFPDGGISRLRLWGNISK